MNRQLHIISTGKQSMQELVEKVVQIQPYIDFIHLREKTWQARDFVEVIHTLIEHEVPKEKIIVNDRVDVAQVTNVYGVQLPYHGLDIADVRTNFPKLRVSSSVHSVEEAKQQEKLGAHSVLFGHVFATSSKQGVPPKGLKALARTVESVNIPVVAIGGMTPDRIDDVLKTGVKGIAALSGILLADHPVEVAKKYREKLDSWKGG